MLLLEHDVELGPVLVLEIVGRDVEAVHLSHELLLDGEDVLQVRYR